MIDHPELLLLYTIIGNYRATLDGTKFAYQGEQMIKSNGGV